MTSSVVNFRLLFEQSTTLKVLGNLRPGNTFVKYSFTDTHSYGEIGLKVKRCKTVVKFM